MSTPRSSVLQLIDQICDQYEVARLAGQRPRIDEYLPRMPEAERSGLLHELLRLERDYLQSDQRRRWQQGERVVVQAYLEETPSLRDYPDLVFELVCGEVLLRGELGERPRLAEYLALVPKHQAQLRRFFVARQLLPPETLQGLSDRVTLQAAKQATVVEADHTVDELPRPAGEPTQAPPGYEVLGELGRGGMGVVYKARQIGLKRHVALKMIRDGSLATPEQVRRFLAEAEAIAHLQHPHIVQIYDIGERDGLPYFCLEFMGGGSLQTSLTGGPLPAQTAAELVEVLARTMHYAHAHGVVHRDLKPANVLFTADGAIKIADFGLAKRLDEPGLTASGAVMGTPCYMAPEQASGRNKEVGPAADVYALGAILYECLTGRPPFRAATVLETIRQVLTEEPIPPSWLRANLAPELDAICLKCLAKEPAERYAQAEELAEDLRRFVGGEPLSALPVDQKEWASRLARRAGYEIIEEVSRGGMGSVYKARQKSLNRLVALKMLPYQPPTHHIPVAVTVHVSMDWQNKRLVLKDVQIFGSGFNGEEAQIEYILDEDRFQLPTPRALFSQPEELARHLTDKLSVPAEIAGTIAQRIIQSSVEEQRHCSETGASRFRIEAETVGQLQHPNIVQIYDFGEVGGIRYFSMEFLEGGTLARKVGALPQPSREAARIVEILARAVHYAHQRGVVHRDLKPVNVLLTGDGLPKVADFGLAKNLHSLDNLDTPCTIIGTPSYMAPEQASGKVEDIGPCSDVYGLGAILYELLTGRPPFPFRAPTIMEHIVQVIHQKPKRPRTLNPHLDPDLEAICLKCLEKKPRDRYLSAEGLAEDLRRFLTRSFWRRAWKWINILLKKEIFS